jgi:hypothetical protein
MPFAFAIVGIIFTIAGVRGRSGDLLDLLKGDLTGENNFIYWIISIAVIGALGYIDAFRPFSRALLALIIIVLILAEDKAVGGGFFEKFQDAVADITTEKGAA